MRLVRQLLVESVVLAICRRRRRRRPRLGARATRRADERDRSAARGRDRDRRRRARVRAGAFARRWVDRRRRARVSVGSRAALRDDRHRRRDRRRPGAARCRAMCSSALELALAIVLLVGAGLLIRSFRTVISRDIGFQPDGAIAAELSLSPTKYPGGRATGSMRALAVASRASRRHRGRRDELPPARLQCHRVHCGGRAGRRRRRRRLSRRQ